MPNEQRPLKVFLCHASQDKPVVRELAQRLFAEGWIDPWLDEKKLLPGQDWRLKIEEAVETSDIVIICLSNNSVSKEGFVQKELRYAKEIALEKPDETIFLIPLRLEDCETPRGLRFYQWGDYFGETKDETYTVLLQSLELRYQQKLMLGEKERARQEKERLEREAAERVEREKMEREKAERTAREKLEREAAEKARREKAEREAAEKAKLDVLEKAKHERAERRTAQIMVLKEILSKSFASLKSTLSTILPFLKIAGIAGIAIGVLWMVLPEIPIFSAAKPTTTVTFTSSPSILIKTPTMFPTLTLTPTKTNAPTVTPTPTPIPPSKILFQRNFEDGYVGASSKDGVWAIEQEPDGNHCLAGSGPATIWFQRKQTRSADFTLEIRVKFIKVPTLYIIFPSNSEWLNDHYGVALAGGSLWVMRTWSAFGRNYGLLPYPGKWYTIRVEIKGGGDSLSLYIDNHLFEELTLQPPVINRDVIGYVINDNEEDKVCFDDIKVWSLK